MVAVLKHYIRTILLIVLSAGLLLSLFTFTVSDITCYKNATNCDEATITLLEPLKGTALFFHDTKQVLTATHPVLPFTVVKVQKKLPSSLIVTVEENPALYVITTPGSQNSPIGVSDNGSYVTYQPELVVPVVEIPELDITQSTQVPADTHQAIKTVLHNSPNKLYHLERIQYRSSTEIVLVYTDLPPIIVSEAVPTYALQHIEKIMYTVQEQQIQQPIKEIDLRFRLPVLRTET